MNFPKKVVIIGAGSFGREVAAICKSIYLYNRSIELLGFLDDNKELHEKKINGDLILGGLDYFKNRSIDNAKNIYFVCSVGDPEIRSNLVKRAETMGYLPISIISPHCSICYPCTIGSGVIIQPGACIAVNSKLEDHVHINFNCSIGHDVHLGKFTTVSPLCALSGFTETEEGCFFGSGVITFPGVKVGKWSKLGAGSIATKDIKPYTINLGVPARSITKTDNHHSHIK